MRHTLDRLGLDADVLIKKAKDEYAQMFGDNKNNDVKDDERSEEMSKEQKSEFCRGMSYGELLHLQEMSDDDLEF